MEMLPIKVDSILCFHVQWGLAQNEDMDLAAYLVAFGGVFWRGRAIATLLPFKPMYRPEARRGSQDRWKSLSMTYILLNGCSAQRDDGHA